MDSKNKLLGCPKCRSSLLSIWLWQVAPPIYDVSCTKCSWHGSISYLIQVG